MDLLMASGIAWTVGFALFLWIYAPILTASGTKTASQPVAGAKSVAKVRSLRVASFGVGTGVTTYPENIGVVAATKVYSSRVVLQSKRSTFSAIRTVALWLPSVCGFDTFRKHLGRCCSKECSAR